ncbi:unnamed protein product [Microthlaspi erraticum]|uniref:Uncharacterized protein n=1 Tax=Microthlaspi erraticum TaxID=1685480 RepID=A0A6D2JK68_9BRAS|nr:unnamed protein product [Microthlaspi erraticum]
MDFIKTSSLHALIELTFQRNWNGLIWMSRNGVITKRVKTGQTALSRNYYFTFGQSYIHPSEVSGKVRNRPADHISRPGKPKPAVGQATTVSRHAAHDHAARAGEQSLAAAQPTSRATADASVRAGKERPTSGRETIGQIFIRPTTPADREIIRPRPFRLGHDPTVRPIVPTDRPNAGVDPKPVLKPDFILSRPGLTLSRLKRPSTIYIAF